MLHRTNTTLRRYAVSYSPRSLPPSTKTYLNNSFSFLKPKPAQQSPLRSLSSSSSPSISPAYISTHFLSLSSPSLYWSKISSSSYHWSEPFDNDNVVEYNFHKSKGPIKVEWFKGGKTNLAYNAVDRWAEGG